MGNQIETTLNKQSTLEERQRAIDMACATRSGRALEGLSLPGCDLSGLRMIHLEMREVDLRGVVCRDVSFPALTDCILDGVDATRARFSRLERCQLRGARLDGAQIGGRMTECDFSSSTLVGARISGLPLGESQDCRGNSFRNADLRSIDGTGAFLSGACFRGAVLRDGRLSRANLSNCDFQDADLAGANLIRATLEGATWTGARLDGCVMTSEQWERLRIARPDAVINVRTISPENGLAISEVEGCLASIEGFNLTWILHSPGKPASEKLMLTNQLTSGALCGYAFEADSGEFIRIHPLGGTATLQSIVLDLLADYPNWTLVPSDVKLEVNGQTAGSGLQATVAGALENLFKPA